MARQYSGLDVLVVKLRRLRNSVASWCGRGGSNPHGHCGPTDFRTRYGFRRRRKDVWGLDYPFAMQRTRVRCVGAARLVSTPSPVRGLARDCHVTGFPEFGQFYSPGFPEGTQVGSSPLRLPFRHARIATLSINAMRCTAKGNRVFQIAGTRHAGRAVLYVSLERARNS